MRHSAFTLPRLPSLTTFLFPIVFSLSVAAQPAALPFTECTVGNPIDPSLKINASTIYGQIVTNDILGRHLNLTVIGNTGQTIEPISSDTSLLSTIFTTSSVLSINIFDNSTFFCTSLRPASPLPTENSTYFFCPVSAGPIAFSAAVPLGKHQYDLLTISTRLRIVDTSSPAVELGCFDVATTPLTGRRVAGSIYGDAAIILWVSVAVCIAYWVVIGLARLIAAWGRGGTGSSRSLWSRLEGAGYILASAISGERFSSTPALLRFSTPSMRDIFFHTQWCAVLGMIAVQWPTFAYPMLAQTAWSTLSFNVTLTQGDNASSKRWNPLTVQDYNPPSNFADQLSDSSSPVFIDASVPNSLLMFPEGTAAGIASLAAAIGLRPQDLFGVCLVLFLAIIAGVIIVSLLIWGLDQLGLALFGGREKVSPFGPRTPAYIAAMKESDKAGSPSADDDGTSAAGYRLFRSVSIPLSGAVGRRSWWRFLRIKPSSFHGSILHGNLVRVLILFHLPITIFSTYQFANARSQSSIVSVVLAVLAFTLFSIGIPVFLVVRLYTTATNKLYDETRTLMMLGPLYNHYAHGSQLFACIFFANNLIYGITIGCGQKSGTTQAIIILVTEIVTSLSTSIWLPWGRGATMGLISFFFCVARITVAVLLVILTPTVSVGISAGSWIAASILFILGLMYLAFLMILAVKLFEALLRIIGRVPFDRSKHTLDTGLLGVMGLLGWCTPRKRRRRRSRRPLGNDVRSSTLGSTQPFAIGNKNSSPPSSSHGPPSVLRPEHALRPYREDSDDESGFIMGSWQPFPQPGYGPVEDRPPSPVVETPPKSGFARVGGGRAHYDTPYAIANREKSSSPMAKHEFPSVERIRQASPVQTPRSNTPTNRSTVTVNHPSASHAVGSGLPPGAMDAARPQVHVRTKSQVAIVEDASELFNLQTGSSAVIQDANDLARPTIAVDTDDSSADIAQPKRTLWAKFRRNRRMSDGNFPSEQPDEGTGKSFVVLRDKRVSPATEASKPDPAPEAAPEENRRSFVVLRGNAAEDNSSSAPGRSTRRQSQTF
ncbi:uncharacterized protein FOMMEDRAFT_111158 [Fomitiporia mediterranea MF3/22]|uniref:uncharacterized protein n=1 Tax=Fomitiporia mediterranea (strain MF3/22) TaxID=694068 RepID=UPI0004408D98|nr:uncharacterized protein FOMMEDRAFT_111158 [Fomitiporia mediterranea MF3/22]EJD01379.1 hypothetical protein FOMMEDRAFT_111158 [Fomitiporia mediterranea MF3/22]